METDRIKKDLKTIQEETKAQNDWAVVDYTVEANARKKSFNPAGQLNENTSVAEMLSVRMEYLKGFTRLDDKERERLTNLKQSIPANFKLKTPEEIKAMSKGNKKKYRENLDKYEEWMSRYNDITLRESEYSSGMINLVAEKGYADLDIEESMDAMDEALENNDTLFNNEDYENIVDYTYAQAVSSDGHLDAAINDYRLNGYTNIKKMLDKGVVFGNGAGLVRGLRTTKLPMDMVTARGAGLSELSGLLDSVEGFENLSVEEQIALLKRKTENNEEVFFSNKKPMSTSRDMEVAQRFVNQHGKNGMIFVVLNKKGTAGLDISMKDRTTNKDMKESEVLLAPGNKYKVIGVNTDGAIPKVYISTQQGENIYDDHKMFKYTKKDENVKKNQNKKNQNKKKKK